MALLSYPNGKIIMHATDGMANAVTETLGYTDINLMDSSTQSSLASTIADFVHNVSAMTGNTFQRTAVTYEIPDLDVVIDS